MDTVTLGNGIVCTYSDCCWWVQDGAVVRPASPAELDEIVAIINRTPAEAALTVLETPVTITGSTVAAVRSSATLELERIREAVLTILAG